MKSGRLLFPIVLLTPFCQKSVLESQKLSIDRNTYRYLREVYYQEQDETQLKTKIENDLAIYALSLEKHFLAHPSAKKFIALEERRRHALGMDYWLKQRTKKSFNTKNQIYRYLKIDFAFAQNPSQWLQDFQSYLKRKGNHYVLTIDPDRIEIGNGPAIGSLTLQDLFDIALEEEKQRVLNLQGSAKLQEIQSLFYLALQKRLDQMVIDRFGAEEEPIQAFSIARAGQYYLWAKYGFAGKGIFPAKPFQYKIHPKEILYYYADHKQEFIDLRLLDFLYCMEQQCKRLAIKLPPRKALPEPISFIVSQVRKELRRNPHAFSTLTPIGAWKNKTIRVKVIQKKFNPIPPPEAIYDDLKQRYVRSVLQKQYSIDLLDAKKRLNIRWRL